MYVEEMLIEKEVILDDIQIWFQPSKSKGIDEIHLEHCSLIIQCWIFLMIGTLKDLYPQEL